jgi:hypothetical protein
MLLFLLLNFTIIRHEPIIDEFVKSLVGLIFVIPAKAGIHPAEGGTAFAGVTAFPTFYEIINNWKMIFSL